MALGVLPLFLPTQVRQGQPPEVAGVALGVSQTVAIQVLGRPGREQAAVGMRFWDYGERGITLIWKETGQTLHGIVVSKRAAGLIGGVGVGDRMTALRSAWGAPAQIRQEGRFLDFARRGWTLTVEVVDGRVVEMTLMTAS